MFDTLNVDVYQLIDVLRFYKETDVDNKDKERKKYWINMLMDNQQDYPSGSEEYMNRLNNLVNHKFLEEEIEDFMETNTTSKRTQYNNFNAAW